MLIFQGVGSVLYWVYISSRERSHILFKAGKITFPLPLRWDMLVPRKRVLMYTVLSIIMFFLSFCDLILPHTSTAIDPYNSPSSGGLCVSLSILPLLGSPDPSSGSHQRWRFAGHLHAYIWQWFKGRDQKRQLGTTLQASFFEKVPFGAWGGDFFWVVRSMGMGCFFQLNKVVDIRENIIRNGTLIHLISCFFCSVWWTIHAIVYPELEFVLENHGPWKSVCVFSKIWRLTCHINSGAHQLFFIFHRSEENGGQQNQPKQKKTWFFQKQGSCFPQTQLRVGGKILPNNTWVANFSFAKCFLWCIPKFGEDVSHSFSSGWFIRTHLSDMKHIQHHPTTSQVLPQAQLSDFSCPALIAVLCANWCCLPHKNGYVNEVYALHI